MTNPWHALGALIAPGSKTIATVQSINQIDGTSIVQLSSGNTLRVQGDTVDVGDKAVIQDGKVISKAPNLPVQTVQI